MDSYSIQACNAQVSDIAGAVRVHPGRESGRAGTGFPQSEADAAGERVLSVYRVSGHELKHKSALAHLAQQEQALGLGEGAGFQPVEIHAAGL